MRWPSEPIGHEEGDAPMVGVFSRDTGRTSLGSKRFFGVLSLEVFGEGSVARALRMVANVSMY